MGLINEKLHLIKFTSYNSHTPILLKLLVSVLISPQWEIFVYYVPSQCFTRQHVPAEQRWTVSLMWAIDFVPHLLQ